MPWWPFPKPTPTATITVTPTPTPRWPLPAAVLDLSDYLWPSTFRSERVEWWRVIITRIAHHILTLLTQNRFAKRLYEKDKRTILVLLGILSMLLAYRALKRLRDDAADKQADAAWFRYLWNTPRWQVLAGLCELHMLKVLPHGYWWSEADGKSLQDYADQTDLHTLLRMGVIPLAIEGGGLDTRRDVATVQELVPWLPWWPQLPEWWPSVPVYVQSNRRASFSLMVPMATGYANRDHDVQVDPLRLPYLNFLRLLRDHTEGYTVIMSRELNRRERTRTIRAPARTDWLEVGARSVLEYTLPFQSDRILKEGKGREEDSIIVPSGQQPRLWRHWKRRRPIVRIESMLTHPVRLEQWVLLIARQAGLREIWDADEMRSRTIRWCMDMGLRVPDELRPGFKSYRR